jgi:hypothetical protein
LTEPKNPVILSVIHHRQNPKDRRCRLFANLIPLRKANYFFFKIFSGTPATTEPIVPAADDDDDDDGCGTFSGITQHQ